jgi:hypothetical protein
MDEEKIFSPVISSEEIQIQIVHQLFYLQSSLLSETEGGSPEYERSVNKSVTITLAIRSNDKNLHIK